MTLLERIARDLRVTDKAGLRRTLKAPCGVDLCSNDYLGLARHPLVKKRMAQSVLRDGAGSTGSRLLRGERTAFQKIEKTFARFKRTGRSLYFSSGYLANLAVLTTYPQEGDVIFSDALNHASLIDGIQLSKARCVVFPHNDVAALRVLMAKEKGQKFLVVESLFSMDGDEAPLRDYAQLCRAHGAALIIDESHAVGVYGARGSGLIEHYKIGKDVFVSINPAGKALGVAGAFVAGSKEVIEYLVQRARPFIFSTAPVPAAAGAIEAALELIAQEPERRGRVLDNARLLRTHLGLPAGSQIIPVIVGENGHAMAVAKKLQKQGFDVRAVRPPTVPKGTARLRISIHANLSKAVVLRFARALKDAL